VGIVSFDMMLFFQGGCMQRRLWLVLVIAGWFCVAGEFSFGQQSKGGAGKTHATKSGTKKPVMNAFTPDAISYGPAPAFLPAGAQLAVLEGDPMGTGAYTIRVKAPDGYKIPPHWHPRRENVTVVEGTIKFGMGDKFDESKMMNFPAGSFAFLDPSMHHYAMTS